MLDLYNIQDLMQHYKMYLNDCDKNTIDKIEALANADIEEVVHPTHEYPTFLYYIVLVYLDSLKNYAKFSDMSDDDRYRYTKDTIKEIRRVWELPVTQRMIEFLKETYNICMPYRNSWIIDNTLNYTFNNINRKHLDDFETLCEMMGLKYESAEFVQHHQYEIKIFF